jgi:hypothetical protein
MTFVDDEYENELLKSALDRQLAPAQAPAQNTPRQSQVLMRRVCVQWFCHLVVKYHLHEDTLYLAVQNLDRVLEIKQVKQSVFCVVAAGCFLLAHKYDQDRTGAWPRVADMLFELQQLTSQPPQPQPQPQLQPTDKLELLAIEAKVWRLLEYDLTRPTVTWFLRHFWHQLTKDCSPEILAMLFNLETLAKRLVFSALLDMRSLNFFASDLAFSCLRVALERYEFAGTAPGVETECLDFVRGL